MYGFAWFFFFFPIMFYKTRISQGKAVFVLSRGRYITYVKQFFGSTRRRLTRMCVECDSVYFYNPTMFFPRKFSEMFCFFFLFSSGLFLASVCRQGWNYVCRYRGFVRTDTTRPGGTRRLGKTRVRLGPYRRNGERRLMEPAAAARVLASFTGASPRDARAGSSPIPPSVRPVAYSARRGSCSRNRHFPTPLRGIKCPQVPTLLPIAIAV